MKILFVITGLGMGGAEQQVCLLADELSLHNHEVKIVSLAGKVVVTPRNTNIEIINLDMQRTPLGVFLGIIKLRRLIKLFSPDVVHGHMFHANIISRLASLSFFRKFKVISTAHSTNEGGGVRMLAYRFTNKLCDLSTNVSDAALNQFISMRAFSSDRAMIVYNGISVEKFQFDNFARKSIRDELSVADNDIMLLAVGRLASEKDYPNLISAFYLLPDNYKLIIVGEGDLRPDIEKLILTKGLESRVKLLGVRKNVSDYYSACDLFVSSSAWEGFGLVLAEAMSCNRLVVATDSGGGREVIGDEGYLVPVGNSQCLAEKIQQIMMLDEKTKDSIMRRNREYVLDNFSATKIVEKWEQLYSVNQGL